MNKKIIIFAMLLGLFSFSYAQDSSVFDKYEDYDDVTTVVVSKKAFTMLKTIANDSSQRDEFQDMVSGLQGLKVFTTSDNTIAAEMQATFTQYRKSAKLEELMRVKDKDANVKIYVKDGKDADHVSEFLMLVDKMNISQGGDDPKVIIISIIGDIDLNNISKITNQMDIPGGEHMEKAARK